MTPDYYTVLNVHPGASAGQIHRQYRALARSCHPDRNLSSESQPISMALVNEAWAVLGDASRRKAYDRVCIASEPPTVQDAILASARSMLVARAAQVSDARRSEGRVGDLILKSGPVRTWTRLIRTLGTDELELWLQSAAIAIGSDQADCTVLMACRISLPDEIRLRLQANRSPAVAIDLIESTVIGVFHSTHPETLFRPFCRPMFHG